MSRLSSCDESDRRSILATFTLPPDHRRIAIVTPIISGGSLAGILEWRSRLAGDPKSGIGVFGGFKLGHKRYDGDLQGGLDEEEIKGVVKQVLEGLAYLHGNGFLHVSLILKLLLKEEG